MRLNLNTKIRLGFGIALIVLLLTSLLAYISIQQVAYYTNRVEHTYKVLQHATELRTQIRDAQAAIRGYLLLTDKSYLNNYDGLTTSVHASYQSLRHLTFDNPSHQRRLDTLGTLLTQEILLLDSWRQRPPTIYAARDLVRSDRRQLEEIRAIIARIKNSEDLLLRERTRDRDIWERMAPMAIIGSAVLAILIVLWLFSRIVQELKEKESLQAELADVNRTTTQRIQLIENLAEQVVLGDYKVKIRDKEQDSLGKLAGSLNRMTQTLDNTFEALNKRNLELDQFAYVASHDLKAPLRGIGALVKWMEEELSHELSAQMHEYLNMLKGRLTRLDDLINGLLAYARAGRTQPLPEEVDVRELVAEVAEMVVPHGFTVDLPPSLPPFLTDRLSLQQVFTNLLSNAVKHHHSGQGHLSIGVQELKKEYEVSVTDDGPGIAPEYHEKIFQIFQTLRDRNTAESTGIGLSIVRKIIEEHKGSIRVQSVPGQGATFVFTWPKALAPVSQVITPATVLF
ncbi:CHASE3 domain-containing protein [Hymenobacter sp. BT188]|uniref:sensor histidine kinase n=1 Tax=Hymenobacter sp. BT188 TaxID=2763504 RepID=UPI0016517E94|nr:ATP-binding protein [Hymenobacter sp. BT188]MBC6607074.1 CHASE3 domain-containing protein [Hymenobacter sp. BT188]